MEDTNPKQQVTELLRKAETIVIVPSAKASTDQVAATIALTQMLDKLGKRPEPVLSEQANSNLSFLPLNILHKEFRGLRDFIIELDTSKTEADKLKYVPEGKKLKIYITPFNGNFSKEDLSANYGDYHCDAIVMLGTSNPSELDSAVAEQKQLLAKAQLVSIVAGGNQAAQPAAPAASAAPLPQPPAAGGANSTQSTPPSGPINWQDSQASSLCEMLMSLTEALQPGLLDNHIATSLLTGIVGATDHFTEANTTPKVMTMAAQLMAAGADQGSIIKHLEKPPAAPKTPLAPPPSPPAKADGSLLPDQEQTLPHHPPAGPPTNTPNKQSVDPPRPNQPPASLPEVKKPSTHQQTPVNPMPPPKFSNPSQPPRPVLPPAHPAGSADGLPSQPAPSRPVDPGGLPPPIRPEIGSFSPTPPPPAPGSSPPEIKPQTPNPRLDVESARRAVEEASRDVNPSGQTPPPPSGSS